MPGKDLAQSLKNRLGFLLLAQLQPHLLRLPPFPRYRTARDRSKCLRQSPSIA